jgi:L-lactate dehydrogenase (cytochrome)/(S)-mandelate dehydrogenase
MTPESAINLEDLRKLAKRRVPKIVYDFIEGGVDSEDGLVTNEDAFRRRALLPRYMVDVTTIDQSTTLFGRRFAAPYGIAPTGGIGNYRMGGDRMLWRAAKAADIPFVMSTQASHSLEEMAREAPEHGWFQLYSAKDREISYDMIRRCEAANIPVLVVTVDVPVGSNRERNRRNGFGRPLKLSLGTKLNALTKPLWLKEYLTQGLAMQENWRPYAPAGSNAEQVGEFVATQLPVSLTWADIEKYRELWPGKLVLKGVMRVDDAVRAAEIGVDGLILSNHGARQLDRAPSALDVLPAVDAAVGDRMTLMLDGGIRRGADVLIALATGAKFVFLGRPTLYGCVAGGQPGAARAMGLMGEEIGKVMKQMGVPSIADLGPSFLHSDQDEGRNW